jgi:flagellar basal body-associated protein FliL
MYLLLIVLAVVVVVLVLGGIGYSRRGGSQNTTIIED